MVWHAIQQKRPIAIDKRLLNEIYSVTCSVLKYALRTSSTKTLQIPQAEERNRKKNRKSTIFQFITFHQLCYND